MQRNFAVSLFLVFTSLAFGQTPKAAPPPQTPRQAILDMVTANDAATIKRHLPETTKWYWASRWKDVSWNMGTVILQILARIDVSEEGIMVKTPKSNPNFETFTAGPVLVRARDPQNGSIAELRIDSEDFANDEDTMELSFNVNEKYVEHEVPMQPPNLRVRMKLEAGSWRLEEIDVIHKLVLDDPVFIKHSLRQEADWDQHWASDTIQSVVAAEADYFERSGGKDYSCSLTQLAPEDDRSDAARSLNNSLHQTEDYKIQLSNCTAVGFRVTAIPLKSGERVFCGDQSGMIKSSPTAAQCFVSGQPVREQ